MTRARYRVLAVDVAEQHEAETIYRVKVRHSEHMEPTYVLYVSQSPERDAPYAAGQNLDVDARLVDREEPSTSHHVTR